MTFPIAKTMPSRDLNQLHPAVKKKCEEWLSACKEAGIPVVVTQTYRTKEYQHKLFLKRPKVTNCDSGTSPHEFRVAWDFCINIKGKAWDVGLITKAGKIAQKLGCVWGGDFNGNGKSDESFIDRPHIEYNGKYTARQIRAGKIPI